ncbi:MAG: FeoA domain-containing protein [Halothiobacillus sp.]
MFSASHWFARSTPPLASPAQAPRPAPSSASFGIGLASLGACVRVTGLTGEFPALAKRLEGMGIHPGSELEVIQREAGALIVRVGNTRVALGAGMAHKILVTPCV